eukprot:GHVP01065717.1.p1 GENE.GHVP01065717.1~~GHVP01065717.1.p1  ORF type:complete len:174 (+),score=28.47 GHVP01065717.1:72-593(+)
MGRRENYVRIIKHILWTPKSKEDYKSYKGLVPALVKILKNSPKVKRHKSKVMMTIDPDANLSTPGLDPNLKFTSFIYKNCPREDYFLAPVIAALCQSLKLPGSESWMTKTELFKVIHEILLQLEAKSKTQMSIKNEKVKNNCSFKESLDCLDMGRKFELSILEFNWEKKSQSF